MGLVDESGGQTAKDGRELGIHDSSLGNLVWRAREEAGGAPTAEERAEIRELEQVKRERDILGEQRPTSRHETRGTDLLSMAPYSARRARRR